MRPLHTLLVVALMLGACGDGGGAGGGSAASTGAATSSARPATSASPTEDPRATDKPAAPAPGTTAELRAHSEGIMAALKRGDAKAAAAYCKGKHHDAFEKYLAENIERKSKKWHEWDGKLGELRVDGASARAAYHRDDHGVSYLSFRKLDGSWSLDDTPSSSKAGWEEWGTVVKE